MLEFPVIEEFTNLRDSVPHDLVEPIMCSGSRYTKLAALVSKSDLLLKNQADAVTGL